MAIKIDEAQLAAEAVAYLESCGHDVYQEVPARRASSGGIIDIVALVGKARETWAVETKTSLSLGLLVQCRDRRRVAHRVFAAAPSCSRDVADLAAALGIGVMTIRNGVHVLAMAPKVSSDPRYGRALRDRCQPGHKTHAAAGTNGGGRYTPFRDTCDQLAAVVREVPGISLRDAIDQIRHHYGSVATARATLPKWIEAGKVPGVEVRRVGRLLHLHPVGAR